jgi:hypothetical protein
MASPAFTLQVPADSDFRSLLGEVAGRYAEIAGASAAECEALARALADRVGALPHERGEQIELACTPTPAGVDVSIRANGRVSVVHHPLAAGQS